MNRGSLGIYQRIGHPQPDEGLTRDADAPGFATKRDCLVSLGIEYRGGYTESNGVITFEWEGSSVAGTWSATGTVKDGSLTVQYNLAMQLSDFEDALYLQE